MKYKRRTKSQIEYLLTLLGRKRTIIEQELDNSNSELENQDIDIMQVSSWNMAYNENVISFSPYTSLTTETQKGTTEEILETYSMVPSLSFRRMDHLKYVIKKLTSPMMAAYKSLDANHPWMMYWLLNSNCVIKQKTKKFSITDEILDLVNDKIQRCIVDNGNGGIAGGANQIGHVASSYAAILTLVLTKNYKLLEEIKDGIYSWLLSLKTRQLNGFSFIMHENGEFDTRSTYCVLVIASLLNILTDELIEGVEEWILSCQTYEGGFGGTPYTEAHGGYTFCAMASLMLLNTSGDEIKRKIEFDKFVHWCVHRQTIEGGFNGRSNKLVDACYCFWIGALFPMIDILQKDSKNGVAVAAARDVFDKEAMMNYLLRVAQVEDGKGGFRDKPGTNADFYHTNYSLCGLSLFEHEYLLKESDEFEKLAFRFECNRGDNDNDDDDDDDEIGQYTHSINPVFGVPIKFLMDCQNHFKK
ncbi:RAM1 [Candida oxycetoniae]|uniref:Protein farnesyltransferase subunit beta n=1 Tax=Candida oxycetoniae TaxID=497107 RepID=A0AAI9SZI9_9ASCO|nr:RAM1 [Candida oxycetoniae]KAI3405579.2 RAM1 [Candida oxycetoniae]